MVAALFYGPLGSLLGLSGGCDSLPPTTYSGEKEVVALEEWSDAWLLAEGRRYRSDLAHRRASMLAALVNHDNLYSRTRIASYGHGDRGWDRLPEWNPRSRTITVRDRRTLENDERVALGEREPLWDGETPTSMRGWVDLGRRVFFEYPLRADRWLEHGLTDREVAEGFGILETASGETPGAIVFRDLDGEDRVGISCAICHTAVSDTGMVAGQARREFNYGSLQLWSARERDRPLDPALAERMAHWGPGRADITEDDDEDPVAIPDLWGLRHQSHFTQAGTIKHIGPVAIALRQETQYLYANHHRSRPPRTLMWALTMYLYALSPPARGSSSTDHSSGEELFRELCADCHSNPVYGGQPVNAEQVGTDPGLSRGIARGTGRYRPSSLIRAAARGPYFHHGAVATLEDVVSPRRLADDYEGPLGRGAVPGHEYGLNLDATERETLLGYLRTL
ncbi:MAG: hypothetical protein AAGF12_38060 [Myxococcota bacterium]